jgi:NADP-dependent 3-hydroxy acid dehydrogenase YdfG
MSELLELPGRCAVITGAASGIGAALAREAAAAGMSLALCDVSAESLASLADELRAGGADVLAEVVDVSSAQAVAAFADKTRAAFPSIAVVFANAGLMRPDSAVRPNLQVWNLTVGVNLMGVLNTVAAFLPQLVERAEPAQFVITASQAAFAAGRTISAYCATKSALWAFSEALAAELAAETEAVKASLLAPGRVASGITMATRERTRAVGGDDAAAAYERLLMPANVLAGFALDQARQRRFWILPAQDYQQILPPRIKALLDPAEPHPLPSWGA